MSIRPDLHVIPGGEQPEAREEHGTKVIPARESRDVHFEIELDTDPTPDAGKPVYAEITVRDHTELPIIPASLRGANLPKELRRIASRILHAAGYHTVRSPWYTALAIWWAPRGLWRAVSAAVVWAWDLENERRAKAAPDEIALAFISKIDAHRRRRLPVFFGGLAVTLIGGLIVVFAAPWWMQAMLLAVAVPALARAGRPLDRRIIQPAIVAPRFRKLTPDIVLRAYYAAGLGHPDKPNQQIQFGSVMARDPEGQGSTVLIDLPYGKNYTDAVSARAKIASGLDVKTQQVYLTEDPTSDRRHRLWVADRDPLAVPAGRTPLLDCKPRNIWRPAPFGLDERNRQVNLLLLWISILVGAQPRKGKTFSARLLALYAALDPYVKMTVVDGKDSPDWRKFELIAHRIIFGVVPNRYGDPIEMLLEALREIKAHIQQVNAFLSTLPVTECPDGKLTEELSRKYPNLRVWVLVMEEFQVYFELDDQETNKEVAALLSFIMAVGPSAGVIILSSSQKPSGVGAGDVQRLFNRFRDNHAVRFALKCGNRLVSEAVLGGDAYSEGFDASALPVGPQYRGVGYLYGASDETPTVRTYLADAQDAEKILTAARKYREQLGTLTGMAAGEDLSREVRDVLYDVQRVARPGEAHMSWRVLAVRLKAEIPEAYADITQDAISDQVRKLGVPSVNVRDNETGDTARGCKLAAVEQAIQRRAIEAGSGSGRSGSS